MGADDGDVLLIDDSEGDRVLACEALGACGVAVRTVEGVRLAEEALRARPPRVVVTDWRLDDGDGEEILELVSRLCPGAPVVVLTGSALPEDLDRARRRGAVAAFMKPSSFAGYEAVAALVRDLVLRTPPSGAADAPAG